MRGMWEANESGAYFEDLCKLACIVSAFYRDTHAIEIARLRGFLLSGNFGTFFAGFG